VSSMLPVENRKRLPRSALSSLASRPLPDTVSRIGASFCLACLPCFLWFPQGAGARTQDSPVKAQQSPSSTTPVSAVQTNASSASAKDAAEPSEPLAPDPALAPARLLLQQGKLSEAEAATRNFLLAHADSAEAHFLLGFILFREIGEKWREAGKAQEATLPYSDGSAIGSLAEFRDAKARESLAEFTAGARYHAASAFDLKIVALDYLLLKHNMDADRWLTQSVQLNSRDAQAWYYLGRTKYSTGQFREAIEAFEQCLKLEPRNVDADRWLTQSVQLNSRDAQAWYYLGRTKYSTGQFREAIEAFEECLKLEPRNVEAENNVGLSYEALRRPDEAIQAFENAIAWQTESSAKNPEPFIELAHLYLNENQPEKAVPYLSQSIAISPNVSKAHEELGKAYSLLHRLSEAQAELEKAIELTPQAPNLHCLLAAIYSKQGLEEKAKAESDRCAALSGTHSTS